MAGAREVRIRYATDFADRGTRQLLAEDRKVRKAIAQTDKAMDRQGRSATAAGKAATRAASSTRVSAQRVEKAYDRSASAARRASHQTSVLGKSQHALGGHLKRVGTYALGAASAYAGIAAAKGAVQTTEDLAKTTIGLNRNLGLSVRSASAFAAVLKSRGVETKQVNMLFGTLSKNIDAANKGGDSQIAIFKSLGISHKELKSQKPEETMNRLADGFKKLGPGPERTALGMRLFGRGWQAMLPLLRDGSVGLKEQTDLVERYGATLKGKTVAEIRALIKAQRESKIATMGLQVAFGTMLAPALTKAMTAVNKFVLGIRHGTGAGGKFRKTAEEIWKGIKPVVTWFGKAVVSIAKFAGQHPALLKFAGAIVAVGLAFKALRFAGAITGVTRLLGLLRSVPGVARRAGAATAAAGGPQAPIGGPGTMGPGKRGGIRGALRGRAGAIGLGVGVAGMVGGQAIGGQGGQAVSRAAAGALMGSMFGPGGALAGALVGGLTGLIPKGRSAAKKLNSAIAGALKGGDLRQAGFTRMVKNDISEMGGTKQQKHLVMQLHNLRQRAFRQFGGKGQLRMSVALDPKGAEKAMRTLERNFNRFKAGFNVTGRQIRQASDQNFRAIAKTMGVNSADGRRAVDKNMKATLGAIRTSLHHGWISADTAMKEIRHSFRVNSAGSRDAARKNFGQASAAIRAAVDSGKISSRDGLRAINQMFREYLAQFGITGKTADLYIRQGRGANRTTGLNPYDAQGPVDRGTGAGPGHHLRRGGIVGMARGGTVQDLSKKTIPRQVLGGPESNLKLGAQRGLDLSVEAANEKLERARRRAIRRRDAAAAAAAGGGAGSTTGLTAQVKRAIAWARGHGWGGSITSGFRSRAKQEQLYANRGSNPNPVAVPGTSMHERGLAIDVTDQPGFARAMASAPANSKLIWYGPGDPVHWSTTGRRRGGAIRAMRGGGVPVALSPGELIAEPGGRQWTVPGARAAADSFHTALPVGSQVFTDHGQSMLASGASPAQAIAQQMPHFRGGGKVGWPNNKTYDRLMMEGVWTAGGGPMSYAHKMASIAWSESRWRPWATNPTDGGKGLWQITPAQPGSGDALTNAKQSVAKFNDAKRIWGQPLHPWNASASVWSQRDQSPGAHSHHTAAQIRAAAAAHGSGSTTAAAGKASSKLALGAALPTRTGAFASGYEAESGPLWGSEIVKAIVASGKASIQTERPAGARGGGGSPADSGASGKVGAAIAEANRMHAAKYAYQWGGGHTQPARPTMGIPGGPHRGPHPGYDCSGAVARVMQKAGFNFPTSGSGSYSSWGSPGAGKKVTVYSSPTHTFMSLRGPKRLRGFGTGANAAGGPGWLSYSSRPGFTARHPKGYRAGGRVGLRAGGMTAQQEILASRDHPAYAPIVHGGARAASPMGGIGSALTRLAKAPVTGDAFKGILQQFTTLIDVVDETTAQILSFRLGTLKQRIRRLRRHGVTKRERRTIRTLRAEGRDIRQQLAPPPSYARLERTERQIGRRIRRLQRGGVDRQESVAIRRLEAAQRIVNVEMGRRTKLLVTGVEKQGESMERARTNLSRHLRLAGVEESSSAGLGASLKLQRVQVGQLTRMRGTLRKAMRRALKMGDRTAVADITERLRGIGDDISEGITNAVELWRGAVQAAAQHVVDLATHRTSMAGIAQQRLELQQRLAGTFETGGAARAAQIRGTVIPGLQAEEKALRGQLAAAQRTGNKELALQIAEAIAGKQNDILQAQLDASEAIKENTDPANAPAGSTTFEAFGQRWNDLIAFGTGA